MAGDDTRKWHRYLHFWRANIAADVDAELTFHVDARTEELCDAGLERSAARAQAIREFGDVDLTRRTLRAHGRTARGQCTARALRERHPRGTSGSPSAP